MMEELFQGMDVVKTAKKKKDLIVMGMQEIFQFAVRLLLVEMVF